MTPLETRIQQLSQPLAAQPTGVEPVLPSLRGIRAVVFDVYGTLLVSGSGDISLASEGSRGGAAIEAFEAVSLDPDAATGEAIVEALHAAVRASHAASESEHPEVEIRDVWREALKSLRLDADSERVERLAVEYECRVNPIWPMPELRETLETLQKADVELGIVSNAQFFTPLAFEPLTGKSLGGWGFDPQLSVWSYEHGEAKPGVALYNLAAAALAEKAIAPSETLFIGNDLRNDIWPAQRVGMRAALFAGDARSLRLREDDPRLSEVAADAVVTRLGQLPEVIGEA